MEKVVIIFTVVYVIIGSAQATIIDQRQDDLSPGESWLVICPDWLFAQTFTAGTSGQLEKIDLYLDNTTSVSGGVYPTTISIVNVNSDVPNGSILGQVFADSLDSGFNSIDFLQESISLTAGVQYGIVLSNDDSERYTGDSTHWRAKSGDIYSRGSLWFWSVDTEWTQSVQPPGDVPLETFYDKDATFITYMVPEPTTILLLGFGSLLLRKRK